MTSKAYKTLVGAFVLGGIALFTIGLVILGSGRLLSDALEYVLYFDGSVNGLSVGAPVVFRGVPMGTVTQISLVANASDSNVTIPVTIQIDRKSFIRASGASLSEKAQAEIIRRMVDKGLRARLVMGSLITGQYKIELDFFPNTRMSFRSSDPDSEIPTIPSPIDTLQKTFARLPIDKMADSLTEILTSLNNAVGNGQLSGAINSFTGAFDELHRLFAEPALKESLVDMLNQMEHSAKKVFEEIPVTLEIFNQTMRNIGKAADEIGRVSRAADNAISPDSPTMNELRRLIREATAAARSLHNFADMLERNPEALLKGRQGTR